MKKWLAVIGCLLWLSAPVWAEDKVIRLLYKPKSELMVRLKNPPATTIFFETFKDARPHPVVIGENQEDRKKSIRILVENEKEVSRFIQGVLKEAFREKGWKTVTAPPMAEKRIGATVLKCWTLETRTYQTETELLVEVKDQKGETFFKKTYTGSGSNRGRSLSETNYQESISESLNRLVENILSDPEFFAALSERREETHKETPAPPKISPAAPPAKEEKDPVKEDAEKRRKMKEAEEKLLEEKRLQEIREAEKRLEEKRLEEQKAAEKRLEEIRAEERRLEELRSEIKRLEEKKAEEKKMEEIRAQEKKLEELREEIRRLEEKWAKDKAAPSASETPPPAEEKTPVKGKAKKPAAAKPPQKSKETYFGPK